MSNSVIQLNNIYIRYPIIGADSRSFKRKLVSLSTGGQIKEANKNTHITVEALSEISFSLQKGDKLGLIGHNGAGKSTLLKVIAGIYEPCQGAINVTGIISSLLSLSVGMQMGATGYENIRMRCIMLGLSHDETKRIIKDVEEFTELGDYLSMPVKVYSSGMQVRLTFGIATAITPDILLLDEVVGAGDAQFIKKAQSRLDKLIKNSNILVLASHSNDLVKKFCNKALWLEHGKTRLFGNVNEVVNAYEASLS